MYLLKNELHDENIKKWVLPQNELYDSTIWKWIMHENKNKCSQNYISKKHKQPPIIQLI